MLPSSYIACRDCQTSPKHRQIKTEENSKRKEVATKNLEIEFHKGIGKSVNYNSTYNPNYSATGLQTLVNGISGSKSNFRDGQWQGFYGDDIDVIIDLEEITKFRRFSHVLLSF